MIKNYINIEARNYNKKIYRVLSVDVLLEMFEKGENTLSKPKVWDDPFEKFLFNAPRKLDDGTQYKSPLRDRAYGQCWSLNIESDAMWRIYAPNKNGVKIQSTTKKLLKSIKGSNVPYPHTSCYIGAVDYSSKEMINKIISDVENESNEFQGSIGQANSLLIKRKAFKYEEEVRLIYLDPKNEAKPDYFTYSCDVFSLIESITFDPRMGEKLYQVYKSHMENIKYTGKIIQSGLYKDPAFR